MLVLHGVTVADHLLYLVPDTEPIPDPITCAPCGSFVRRNVPWHLAASESGGGDSTVRILPSDKEGFDMTDKHVVYMKQDGVIPPEESACPALTVMILKGSERGGINRPAFISNNASSTMMTFLTDIGISQPFGQDFLDNPDDYRFVFDGTVSEYLASTAAYYPHLYSDYEGDYYSEIFLFPRDFDGTNPAGNLDSYMYIEMPKNLTGSFTLAVQKLGVVISSITFNYTLPELPTSSSGVVPLITLTDISGDFFGQISPLTHHIYSCPAAPGAREITLLATTINYLAYPYIDYQHSKVQAGVVMTFSDFDMFVNPESYTVVMDGETLSFSSDAYLLNWDGAESGFYLEKTVEEIGNKTVRYGSFYFADNGQLSGLEYTGNLKIYKNGELVSDTTFHFVTIVLLYGTRCTSLTVTSNVGDFFTLGGGDFPDVFNFIP